MAEQNQFGLFIHWGLYSLLGLHEQALARYDLDHTEYEALMHRFNPTSYDPEQWVLLAKKAGMQYICFTTKHHDGFCMWDTRQTDYNVMNTPYGKDVLKMLADACKKHGMRLSLYYSNPDWHHPFGYNPASSHQWKAKYKDCVDTEKYREFVKAQVTELLTNYGPIYTFFWDIPPKIEDPSLNELVRSLQPGILINDRGWSSGDFSTPEREYQQDGSGHFSRMTEACNSLGQQAWGYRSNENFYSKRYLCGAIDRYMALGASYLLNVGPDGNGVIPEAYEKRLLAIGDWYCRMEGCLECTQEDPFDYQVIGDACIVAKKDGKTYLHFDKGLTANAVSLKKYPSVPKHIRLMNTGEALSYEILYLPSFFTDEPECLRERCLHIQGIPVDALETEPIVIEITWLNSKENT